MLAGKVVGKDKPSAAGGTGSLPVASPPDQDGNSKDTSLDSQPKKGIIFEICSEDGFHIRCESIEGQQMAFYFHANRPLAKGHIMNAFHVFRAISSSLLPISKAGDGEKRFFLLCLD